MSQPSDSDLYPAYEEWQAQTLRPVLKRFPERKASFKTTSDIPIERLYVPPATDHYTEDLGFPGDYPYTRGIQPTMYRGRLWTMRQYAGFSTAHESNERYKYLLSRGQTGLSVAFDLPTQIGYDPDDPMALGEVGKVGVNIPTLADMGTLLEGIPLDKVSISMTINAPAAILLAMVIAVAKRQGVGPHQLRGTIQNDILKEYIARGTYIFPPRPSMRLITDTFDYCSRHAPHWNPISVSGYHIREAGCTAAQEIAFTLADGITYVQAAIDAGLDVDAFADQVSFFFNAHNNFLEEVAKYRAARRLWARIMRERFKAQKSESWRLRFHTQTGGSTLTAQQPENNIVRVALQALAAVLGGTQSLHTNSMDEALGLPTEQAVRVALRTQQIIAYESGVADTIDPLGGSFAVEALTETLEAKASAYIQTIDEMGGMLNAIESGFINQEIEEAAYRYQQALESKEEIVVGLNEFTEATVVDPPVLKIDPAIEAGQRAHLAAYRAARDQEKVSALRDRLPIAARSAENLMPLFIECVENQVTLGEICHTLRGVWGEYRPTFNS